MALKRENCVKMPQNESSPHTTRIMIFLPLLRLLLPLGRHLQPPLAADVPVNQFYQLQALNRTQQNHVFLNNKKLIIKTFHSLCYAYLVTYSDKRNFKCKFI